MNKLNLIRYYLLILIILIIQSCQRQNETGDIVGIYGREWGGQNTPYGMVYVPPGTFHMGQADEDITSSKINMNRQVTIGGFFMDDTEITNDEYRQFINVIQSSSEETFSDDYIDEYNDYDFDDEFEDDEFEDEVQEQKWSREEIMRDLYPDTSVWEKDFTHHLGDPLREYYFSHPAFDDYPVVGITWGAAKEFCKWRTLYFNDFRKKQNLFPYPDFRLPTEAEWEYGSRGGLDMAKYPWGGPYLRNGKGCPLANLKPGRGNYYDDGFAYTAPVGSYFANAYGLYDMAGNVSEWCEDAYNTVASNTVWDLNPLYIDENESRKIIRGGSWKDIPYYLETGTKKL